MPVGVWNRYFIEANASGIRVTLNGQLVNDHQSTLETGYIALLPHDFNRALRFRNCSFRTFPEGLMAGGSTF
jgi:hypothetical protein